MTEILGVSGSLRANSCNTALLRAATDLAAPDQRVTRWPGLETIPPFNEDHEDAPGPAVAAMRTAVERCDAVLIATPEYNTTVPGQLKNALDWLSRPTGNGPLAGKAVAVIGASQSAYGARWSQQAVRHVLEACGAVLVGEPLCIPHCNTAFTAHQHLRDRQQRTSLARVLTELGQAPHACGEPGLADRATP